MNLCNVYFVSKGTGPRTVQIEAQNSAGVKAHGEIDQKAEDPSVEKVPKAHRGQEHDCPETPFLSSISVPIGAPSWGYRRRTNMEWVVEYRGHEQRRQG